MGDTVYLSKVEFKEYLSYTHRSSLFLNLVEKELSYQVFVYKKNMPSVEGITIEEFNGKAYSYNTSFPALLITNDKTNFKPQIIKMEQYEQRVVFSYGIKLTDEQMESLLPYCLASDFERFRNRTMSMDDEGFLNYRDEVNVYFKATTDSVMPLIELPMNYCYDESHTWPSERLYGYILETFFAKNKKIRDWMI